MPTTREEFFKLLKKISVQIDQLDRLSVAVRSPSVSIDIASITGELQSILTELQSQSTTLSSSNALLTTIDVDTGATAARLLDGGTSATQRLTSIRTNTNATDGKTITSWLKDIDADGDGSLVELLLQTISLAAMVITNAATAGSTATSATALLLLVISNAAILVDTGQIQTAVENNFREERAIWVFRKSYLCTANGTLAVTWVADDNMELIYLRVSASVLTSSPETVDVFHRIEDSGSTKRNLRFYLNAGSLVVGTPIDVDPPHSRTQIYAPDDLELLTSSLVVDDVIEIAAYFRLSNTTLGTDAVGGGGTFTVTDNIDAVRT